MHRLVYAEVRCLLLPQWAIAMGTFVFGKLRLLGTRGGPINSEVRCLLLIHLTQLEPNT